MKDDKPDTDLQPRRLPELGEERELESRSYSPHAGHNIRCTEVLHLGGQEYDVAWTCLTCEKQPAWTVAVLADEKPTWCATCGCNIARPCACARGCTEHRSRR